jgi:hypothetical protein
MCNAFFQVIFRSVAAAAASVLLTQGIYPSLCQPNRISARPQRTPVWLALPPARYLLVCGTAAFSLEFCSRDCHVLAAPVDLGSRGGGVLRQPASGASGDETAGAHLQGTLS